LLIFLDYPYSVAVYWCGEQQLPCETVKTWKTGKRKKKAGTPVQGAPATGFGYPNLSGFILKFLLLFAAVPEREFLLLPANDADFNTAVLLTTGFGRIADDRLALAIPDGCHSCRVYTFSDQRVFHGISTTLG
jgi:hypothetical protein